VEASFNGRFETPAIHVRSLKVCGVGGPGLVAVVGLMAYTLSEVRWFIFESLTGGHHWRHGVHRLPPLGEAGTAEWSL
jgi:hypothetical protein